MNLGYVFCFFVKFGERKMMSESVTMLTMIVVLMVSDYGFDFFVVIVLGSEVIGFMLFLLIFLR